MFSWNLLRTKLLWGLHTMNGITASPNFSMKSNAFSIKSHMESFLYSRFCCLLVTGQSRTFRKEMGIFLLPEIRAPCQSKPLKIVLLEWRRKRGREYVTGKDKFLLHNYRFQRRNNKSSPGTDAIFNANQCEKQWFSHSAAHWSHLR